ncbi:MAG: sulfur carrier protein ThiS [Clostridiales bacterium]|jgi:sulfur carrier protein|nr:sulfur carrier protein ThiS [Clostridiales bacterium]
MKINGVSIPLPAPVSLVELLEQQGYPTTRIAVEKNGEIVPKGAYETTVIADDDVLEIVSFVGGG